MTVTVAPEKTLGGAAIAVPRAGTGADVEQTFATEWRPLTALGEVATEWRALAARALEQNVFYEPAFALPAAAVFGRDVGAVLVWSADSPRQLRGVFPARVEVRRYGIKLPVLVGWTHPYAPLGTPLVDRGAAEPVIAAWLDFLAANKEFPATVLLPFMPEYGPFSAAFGAVCRRRQLPDSDLGRHRRAELVPRDKRALYIEHALGSRKRKELRRLGHRLAERGAMLFTTAREAHDVDTAFADFLTLEASGWKGKAGTAAAGHDAIRGFTATALQNLAAGGQVAIDRLLIDGRAIAASITLRSGDAAWFWKIAYDEDFARYSPGVMLTVAVTEALVEDRSIARTDSCATADHPMIDRIWCERLTLCDRLASVRRDAPFGRVRRLEGARRAIIAKLKAARALLRR
jgi:hypothetical protein